MTKLNEVPHQHLPGRLRSLVFMSHVSYNINKWARYTDFTNLRRLTTVWTLECGVPLAELAMRGKFEYLDTLCLSAIEDETDRGQEALNRLFEYLNPLQQLELNGYISHQHTVLCRHGSALLSLTVRPYRDDESRNPLLIFSEAVVQQLVEHCPNLEQIQLPVNRTRGDDQEIGIYRALSKLPRLKRAFLTLWFSIGPDEDYWDEETDGEYPLSASLSGEKIPFVFLREAFSNSAIDASLALSIFTIISSAPSLSYLRLEMRRKMGLHGPSSFGYGMFEVLLRWFNRSWVCKQDIRGELTVRELDRKGTALAGEEWRYLSEEPQYEGEDVYQDVFKDIWPQRTPEWWKDWKSLPLSDAVT
jgi:hypothetical protein